MFDASSSFLPWSPLHQSDEYARTLAQVDAKTTRLADGTLVLQRRIRGFETAMLPRANISQNSMLGLIRDSGMHKNLLVVTPDDPAPWLANLGAVAVMSPSHVAHVDLSGDLEAQMHQKWRNRLRAAERQNLRITRQNLPVKPDNWILRHDGDQQKARRYKTWTDALTLAYAKANRGNAKLFTAFDGKTEVAAMLFLRHGDCATYHIGHTTDQGRATNAHNLLLWEAMTWLASKGVTHLELGQVDTETSPGLARFKLGVGARVRPLGGTWLWWPPLGKALTPLKYLDRRAMSAR
ncbi:FemAB family protein [Shimia sp. SK013]|uniref:GNAT family N-acetyltransferase n=1 Tax=Shimia sp. SK013 TaxID=1389006 RepID=UPI0006B60FB4|nr:GNAT family N-acetyltransferase [Shimia sp. SK013]KPA21950.1 FemAB family protein [Shimia sp. SK013]